LTSRRAFCGLLLVLACLLPTAGAWTHPHAFAECGLDFVFDEKGLAGVRVRMAFDEMFSVIVLQEIDPDLYAEDDPELDREHVEELELMEFKDYGYFTHILVDGRRVRVEEVEDFSARVRNGRLTYELFVPCAVAAGTEPRRVTVSVFDDTYYREMTLPNGSVSLQGGERFSLNPEIGEIEAFAYRYGGLKLVPQGVSVGLQRKGDG